VTEHPATPAETSARVHAPEPLKLPVPSVEKETVPVGVAPELSVTVAAQVVPSLTDIEEGVHETVVVVDVMPGVAVKANADAALVP
jgi:hypothetical protein